MLGVAFGAGFVLGPALGGLAGTIDPRLPFWIAGGLSLVNALYGFFVLPESLPPERRAPFAWRRANPLGSLALLRSHPQLLGLAERQLSRQSRPCQPAEYRRALHDVPLRLGRARGRLHHGGVGVCAMIVQGADRPHVARFGERAALIVGLLFGVAGFAVFGLAATGPCSWPASRCWRCGVSPARPRSA